MSEPVAAPGVDPLLQADRGGELRTRRVLILTLLMMVAEVGAGTVFGSMALLADGWHMLTHAAAMGISVFAYVYARKHASNKAYVFGTGKVSALGGFASAVVLGVVAVLVGITSGERLAAPVPIRFDEAMIVTAIGLVVNLLSAWMLGGGGDAHAHAHAHADGHGHDHGHDHNLRAAYLHVLADALTSVLALFALVMAKFFDAYWMDPMTGLVAAIVIARWSIGLLRETSRVLLDVEAPTPVITRLKTALESEGCKVVDLKLWPIGSGRMAATVVVETGAGRTAAQYRALIPADISIGFIAIELKPRA